MKYKVLATSITTHLGRILSKDDVVASDVLHADHIPDLLSAKLIEEVKAEKPPKVKDNGETV